MKARIMWQQFGMILATVLGVVPLAEVVGTSSIVLDVPQGPRSHVSVQPKTESASTQKPQKVQPPPPAPPSPPPIPAEAPSHVLDLTNWKLTLPVDTAHAGSPDEITQPELASFSLAPYFLRSGSGVAFRAHAGGATTANSGYPRSELREMTPGGGQRASWSNTAGNHSMTIRQAITHVPAAKPHVVAGQIHDGSDDVIMIRLEGNRLFVEADGKEIGLLDPAYGMGAVFTVQIVTQGGHIQVHYNGALKVDYARAGAGFYFKAGCYTQSNPSKGDAPEAYGQVVIYSLQVSHA